MSEQPKQEIFWERGNGMRKFHAFTLNSGVSLCKHWFMGGAAHADDLDIMPLNEQEFVKCKACKKVIK